MGKVSGEQKVNGYRSLVLYFTKDESELYHFLKESVGNGHISAWVRDAIRLKRSLGSETPQVAIIRRVIREELERVQFVSMPSDTSPHASNDEASDFFDKAKESFGD